MEKSSKILLWIIMLSVFAVIFSTGYKFLLQKNYNFLVEASCDPVKDICYYRDCSNPDDCPPNGLENYKMFSISAKDFPKCSDNSCLIQCTSGFIDCEEIYCDASVGEDCSIPEIENLVDANFYTTNSLEEENLVE